MYCLRSIPCNIYLHPQHNPKHAVLLLGYQATQGCACACVTAAGASRQLKPAYLAYLHTLNRDNSAAATTIKLCQSWLAVSTLWRLLQLLRVNLLLGWLWRNMLWPLLLGLVWRPRIVTTVRHMRAVQLASQHTCLPIHIHMHMRMFCPLFSHIHMCQHKRTHTGTCTQQANHG